MTTLLIIVFVAAMLCVAAWWNYSVHQHENEWEHTFDFAEGGYKLAVGEISFVWTNEQEGTNNQ